MNKKTMVISVVFVMLCFIMPWSDVASQNILKTEEHSYVVTSTNEIKEEVPVIGFGDEVGVWIYTKYNGQTDEEKLDIDINTFKLMLSGGGFKQYHLTLENKDDTLVSLQFVRTKVFLEDGSEVDVLQTKFIVETQSDTTEDFEVSLEVRFPFSSLDTRGRSVNSVIENPLGDRLLTLLNNLKQFTYKLKNSLIQSLQNLFERFSVPNEPTFSTIGESYFDMRIGYASPENDEGPRRVETRFFFGRTKLTDPQVFRMKISPTNMDDDAKISYFNSYLTVDESGSEVFYRTFSVDFDPAAELQVTSIPRQAKISYNFGHSAGRSTEISFRAQGGALDNIIQRFVIDPLPEYMSFDLTVLGERSFTYESDQSYSVTYMVDSVQDGNLVKLDLEELPTRMKVSWGLKLNLLEKSCSGVIDLDMSSDIGAARLYLQGSEKPFISVNHFPKKFLLKGYLDVTSLYGYVSLSVNADDTTTVSVPLAFDKWEITANLRIDHGYGRVSFDLPSGESPYVMLGLDTNGGSLFGLDVIVTDTSIDKDVLSITVEALATDDLMISFDNNGGKIENVDFNGVITKLLNLYVAVDFKGINFDLEGSWDIGDGCEFSIKANQEMSLNLDELEFDGMKLSGTLALHPDSSVQVEWDRDKQGFFMISSHAIDVDTAVDFTFVDQSSNQVNIYAKLVLNPNCIVKFDWDWDQTGHFTVFTNEFLKELQFKVGYKYSPEQQEYQYGFNIQAQDVSIIRTIQWDTENGLVPRIWILGDEPLPGDWDVWLLWNYDWYEVK